MNRPPTISFAPGSGPDRTVPARTACPTLGQRGFTLIEMLVCLAIVSVVSLLLMQSLVSVTKRSQDQFHERVLQNSARLTLARLAREVQSIGLDTYYSQRDPNNIVRQPKLVYAGPYQIVFNADLDPSLGPIRVDAGDWQNEQVGDVGSPLYTPVRDYVSSGADPNDPNDLPLYQNGAETIWIGLDASGDGEINESDDNEDVFWTMREFWDGLDLGKFATPNPRDYVLVRRAIGFNAAAGQNIVKTEVLAIGVHPWLDPASPTSPYLYGDRTSPPVLFQYWGFFRPDLVNSRPRECLFQDDAPEDGALNGDPELQRWIVGGHDEGVYVESVDSNEDDAVNASIDEVLTRIEITLALEEGHPSPKSPNLARSDLTPPTKLYLFRDIRVAQTVVPANIRLLGTNTEGL